MSGEDDGPGPRRQTIPKERMLESIRHAREHEQSRSGRRRRRRSRQPVKRRRLALRLVLGLFILSIMALFGSVVFVKFRIEGSGFREALGRSLEQRFGGDVEVGPLELHGTTVFVPWVTVEGAHDGTVERAELKQVEIELAWPSFVGSTWRARSVSVDKFDLVINPWRGERAVAVRGGMVPRVGLAVVPVHWQIGELHVEALNIDWLGPEGEEVIALDDAMLGAARFSDSATARLSRGMVRGLGNDLYSVVGAEIAFEEGRLAIMGGKLRSERERGELEIEGSISLRADEVTTFRFMPRDIDLRAILSEPWREHLLGRLEGEIKIEHVIGSDVLPEWDGAFRVEEGVVRGFELLDRLSDLCGESKLMRVELDDEAECRVKRSGGVLSLEQIQMKKPGLLQVTGALEFEEDGSLSGQLQVGVPETFLVRSPWGRPAFFGSPVEGFSAAEVVLSGSAIALADDLSSRLRTHAGGKSTREESGFGRAGSGARTEASGDDGPEGTNARSRLFLDEKAKLEALFEALLK
jgi:hypothetical protein